MQFRPGNKLEFRLTLPGRSQITPKSFPNLALWLKPESLLNLNNGDHVPTWADSSGNGNNASQATQAAQPFFNVNGLNGRPVISLSGAGSMGGNLSGVTNALSLFIVAKIRTDVNNAFFDCSDTTGTNRSFLFFREGGIYKFRAGSAGGATITDADTTGYHLWSMVSTAGSRSIWKDGASINTETSSPTIAAPTTYRIGSLFGDIYNMNGLIATVIAYSTAVSAATRIEIQNYLAKTFALTVS